MFKFYLFYFRYYTFYIRADLNFSRKIKEDYSFNKLNRNDTSEIKHDLCYICQNC